MSVPNKSNRDASPAADDWVILAGAAVVGPPPRSSSSSGPRDSVSCEGSEEGGGAIGMLSPRRSSKVSPSGS